MATLVTDVDRGRVTSVTDVNPPPNIATDFGSDPQDTSNIGQSLILKWNSHIFELLKTLWSTDFVYTVMVA